MYLRTTKTGKPSHRQVLTCRIPQQLIDNIRQAAKDSEMPNVNQWMEHALKRAIEQPVEKTAC